MCCFLGELFLIVYLYIVFGCFSRDTDKPICLLGVPFLETLFHFLRGGCFRVTFHASGGRPRFSVFFLFVSLTGEK